MRLSHLSITSALLLAMGGCVDHDTSSIVVYGNASPTGTCSAATTSSASTPTLTVGQYNIDYARDGYQLFPLVENRLTGRRTELASNPNDLRLLSAEVSLLDVTGSLIPTSGPNPFSTGADALAVSGAFKTPQVEAIPLSYIPDIRAQLAGPTDRITLRVQLVGETLGGVEVISKEWDYPVEIVTEGLGFQCVGESGNAVEGATSCYFGQDFVSDACDAQDTADAFCRGGADCVADAVEM